ncbi:MAG: ppaX 1 [Gemmatimonadetes bacterium]|nr:ppaX 1 [Gemmatimonadota bacterium]
MATSLHPPGSALRTILLDIDGTLIDSNDAHARAWVESLAEHGYVIRFQDVRPLIGMGGDKILPMLTGLDGRGDDAKRIASTRSAIFRRLLPSLQATRGARDLLVRLQELGFELVIATSAREEEMQAILDQAGVADLIETGASSGDADASKPEPDIIHAALRKAGRPPYQALMLGDTPYDIEAATRARVPTIAVRCGGGWSDEDLRAAAAIYDDPAHFLAQLASSPIAPAL